MAHWKPTELVVEVGTNANNDCVFNPLGDTLRGRWNPKNYPGASARASTLMSAPEVPGMYVVLDPTKRTLRAIDPLSLPENRGLLDKLNNAVKPVFGQQGAREETIQSQLTDGQIKTALWEMYSMVSDGRGWLVHGQMPAPQKIMEMPGRVRRRFHSRDRSNNEPWESTEEEEKLLLEKALAS